MAGEGDINIVITADTSDYDAKIAKSEAISARFSKALSESDIAARKLSAAHKQAAESGGEMSTSLEGIGRAARAAGFGQLAEKATNAGKALALLGPTGGILMGVAAGLGVVAVASIKAYQAMTSTVESAVALQKEYAKIAGLSKDMAKDLGEAEEATRATDIAMASLTMAIGADLAPAVSEVKIGIAALTLYLADSFVPAMIGGAGATALWVAEATLAIATTEEYREKAGELVDKEKKLADEAKRDEEATKRLAAAQAKLAAMTGTATERAEAKVRALEAELGATDLTATQEEAIWAEMKIAETELAEATKKTAEERAKAEEEAAQRIAAALKREGEARARQLEAIRKAQLEGVVAVKAHADAAVEAQAAQTVSMQDAQKSQIALLAVAQKAEDSEAANVAQAEAQKLAAKQQFTDAATGMAYAYAGAIAGLIKDEKAAAIVQILIDAARLATGLAASMAYLGPFAIPTAIGLAGGLAAMQIAAVNSAGEGAGGGANRPPKRHLGGSVDYLSTPAGSGYGAGDRHMGGTVVQAGEVYTPTQAANEAGSVFVIQLDHRMYEAQARRSAETGILRRLTTRRGIGQTRYSHG